MDGNPVPIGIMQITPVPKFNFIFCISGLIRSVAESIIDKW